MKYIISEGKVLFIDLMITSVLIVYSGHEYWVLHIYTLQFEKGNK